MKKAITVLGVVFILVGLVGFVTPHLAHAHLSPVHNLIHIVSGALALYFGLRGSVGAARTFCFVFGAVYGLLGIVGFLAGKGGERLLTIIPGALELGQTDHLIHIGLGLVFMVVGGMGRGALERQTA